MLFKATDRPSRYTDNKAYTFSSTYHDGTLKMCSHHPAQPSRPGESPFMSHPYLFPFFLPCFALAVPTVLSPLSRVYLFPIFETVFTIDSEVFTLN
jgi:hypothetical protein